MWFVTAILVAGVAGALGWIAAADRITVQNQLDAAAGSYVVVPIEASADFGVVSASFGLSYSAELLTPLGVYATSLTQDFELRFDIDTPGDLTVDLRGSIPQFESGAIVWILFDNHGAVGDRADLTLHHALLNDLETVDLKHGWIEPLEGEIAVSLPTDLTAGTGELVTAPLSIDDTTGILAIDVNIFYAPEVLNAVSVVRTPISQNFFLTPNLEVPGVIQISLFGSDPMTGSGPILEIDFDVIGVTGQSTPLVIEVVQINEGAIPSVVADGFFVVCDGSDADGDGVSICDGDCDDNDDSSYPGNTEIGCDSRDNDCDPGTPDILDGDNDGALCDVDCDDADNNRFPGNAEICDGVDNNCDFVIDNAPPPGDLMLIEGVDDEGPTFSWPAVADATGYDAVRGVLSDLHAGGGDFSQATEVCLEDDRADTFIDDTDPAPQADGFWYIIRPINCGGSGTYDSGGGAQQEPRDAEANASPNSCP